MPKKGESTFKNLLKPNYAGLQEKIAYNLEVNTKIEASRYKNWAPVLICSILWLELRSIRTKICKSKKIL